MPQHLAVSLGYRLSTLIFLGTRLETERRWQNHNRAGRSTDILSALVGSANNPSRQALFKF
jgi:hypothetical protein